MSLTTNDSFLQWDPVQVGAFINTISEDIGQLFLDNNVEGSLLPFLTTDHLKELGIDSLGKRLMIKKSISDLIADHYGKNPPKGLYDPEYKLNNININSNFINLESLHLATILIKEMVMKVAEVASPNEDVKKLNDSFSRLKTDLVPVFRLLKDSKPLPTPTLDPGHATLDSPNSISSFGSANNPLGSNMFDSLDKSWKDDSSQPGSNRNSNPIPSPTQTNRFSSGSVLSFGTGKVVLNSPAPDPRPRLVESKSSGSTNTRMRKHLSSIGAYSSSSTTLNGFAANSASSTPPAVINNEPLKQLRASFDDSCLKILQQAMKRHHIPRTDWSKYVLVVCYGNKERILKLSEKPVPIFKELSELGKHPAIMLRQLAETTVEESDLYEDSRIGDDIPGGTL